MDESIRCLHRMLPCSWLPSGLDWWSRMGWTCRGRPPGWVGVWYPCSHHGERQPQTRRRRRDPRSRFHELGWPTSWNHRSRWQLAEKKIFYCLKKEKKIFVKFNPRNPQKICFEKLTCYCHLFSILFAVLLLFFLW